MRWTRPAAAVVGVIGLCATATTGAAAASTSATAARSGWRVMATANAALDVGIAPGKTSFWALGSVFVRKFPGGPIRPSGLHWNGRRWSKVTFPASVKSGIGCAGASSAGNAWAFAGSTLAGGSAQYAGALRLVRGRWQVSKSFAPPGLVSGCSVLGNGNAWLYGLSHVSHGVGTWRLRGTKWSRAQTGKFFLITASEVRADDIWAVAADSLGTNDVVAHWNGRSWTRVTGLAAAVPGEGSKVQLWLNAINAVSRGNVWVAGQLLPRKGTNVTNIVLHLSGGKWHKVTPGSAGYYLPGAVRDGRGGWWAITPFTPTAGPVLFREAKGESHWTRVALSVPRGDQAEVSGLVHVPGSTAMLALLDLFNGTAALKTEVLANGALPK